VNSLELLQWLARLRVPHVYFGVLPQLAAGSKRAAADVFSRISLRVRREQNKTPMVFSSGTIIGRAIATAMVRITHRGTGGLPGSRRPAGAGVFLVEREGHDIIAVAREEALPLVHGVHDNAHAGNVVPASKFVTQIDQGTRLPRADRALGWALPVLARWEMQVTLRTRSRRSESRTGCCWRSHRRGRTARCTRTPCITHHITSRARAGDGLGPEPARTNPTAATRPAGRASRERQQGRATGSDIWMRGMRVVGEGLRLHATGGSLCHFVVVVVLSFPVGRCVHRCQARQVALATFTCKRRLSDVHVTSRASTL
jgi:hypothetical protein